MSEITTSPILALFSRKHRIIRRIYIEGSCVLIVMYQLISPLILGYSSELQDLQEMCFPGFKDNSTEVLNDQGEKLRILVRLKFILCPTFL